MLGFDLVWVSVFHSTAAVPVLNRMKLQAVLADLSAHGNVAMLALSLTDSFSAAIG